MEELYEWYDELRNCIYQGLATLLALIIAVAGAACLLLATLAVPFTTLYAAVNKKKTPAKTSSVVPCNDSPL